MANITINDASLALMAAADVAEDDIMPVWDASAGQMKRATRRVAVGSKITGDKALVAPADGTLALIDVAQVYTAGITLPAIVSNGGQTIADDAAFSFTPGVVTQVGAGVYAGLLFIWGRAANNGNVGAVIAFRAGTSGWCTLVAQPAANVIATATTTLTGTTGTDGKVTVSAASDGKIYIENRLGFSLSVGYLVTG